MSATSDTAASPQIASVTSWQAISAEAACRELGVDPAIGLDPAETESRRAKYGPNELAEAEKEPGWHALLRDVVTCIYADAPLTVGSSAARIECAQALATRV